MKNNTFKRIAAGALATISVASYALPANVFGGTTIVNSLGAALVSHAADEEAVVKNDIDFNDARTFINSIAIGDNNIGGNTLAFIDSGKVNAKKGETITIKSKTTLDIDKLIPNSISTNAKYNTAVENGEAIEVTKDDKKDYYIESEMKAEQRVESEPAVPANAKESYTAAANYTIGNSATGKLTGTIETEYGANTDDKYKVYPEGVKAAKADITATSFSFYEKVKTDGDVVLNPTAIADEEGTMTAAVAAEGVDVKIQSNDYKNGQYVQTVSPYVEIEFVGDTPTKLTLKEGAVAYKNGDSKVYTAGDDLNFIVTSDHPEGVLDLDNDYKFYKDVTVANNNEGKPKLYEAATDATLAADKVNIIDVAKADANGNYKLESGLTLALAAGVEEAKATKAFVAKEGYKFIKEVTPATANTPAVYEVKDEIDAADVTYQYYEKVDPQFEVVNTPAPLTAKEDNYSKAYADGEYTYTFKMPEYAVKLNKLAFEVDPGDTEATIAPETAYDNETNKYTAVPGVDMTITSKDKNQLDLTTYVYATDSNGKKIQCTDDKGNLIYKNGEFYYSLVDTKEGGVANNLYNAVKAVDAGELETLTFTANASGDKLNIGTEEETNYKIPKADITKYLTPVYKIEKVKIAATRTPKLNSSAEITNYKYTFKMPDLEEGVNDTVYGEDTLNKVFVAVHQHVHDADAWVYSVSTDGTELYRQCTIDDDDACPEKNQKLLVAMIRNKVTDDEGKVTYNKINKYTYGKAITPVLLTMVFNEDGSPVLNEDKSFKYDEKVLDEEQTYVVVNYEDTDTVLDNVKLDLHNTPANPDDDVKATFGTANVGNYVVKVTPNKATVGGDENDSLYAADVDAREKSELSFYFDVVQKQLTIDNVVTKPGTVYDEKKQVFNVTPISVVEDMDFDIKDGANVLVAGRDYIIIGSTTSSVAGEHTFTVKGIGNYTGTFEVKWDLMGTAATQELTADMVEIETIPHGTYAERVVHVYGLDQFGRIDKTSENATYAITGTQYATEKGTYDITITGTGNYYGTLNLKWYVNRADITGKVSVVDGASFDASDNKLAISSVGSLKPYNPGNGNIVPVSQQTLTKVGLIATKDFSLTENMDVNSNNSAIFVRGKDGADVESKTSYVLTWKKSNSTANDVWYVKPFTQFKIGTKTITVYGDLTRVQGDTAEVIKNGSAQVRMTKSTVKLDANNTGKYVLATNSYLAVPDGCTMLKAGVIASTTKEKVVNKSVLNNEAQSTADGLYVRFKEGNDVAPYQRYSFTWKKTNTADNEVYFVKPFVQYKDADGVTHTVYGDVTKMEVATFLQN